MSTPENKVIVPTIGRKVWLWIDLDGPRRFAMENARVEDPAQALDATVVYVLPVKGELDYYYVRLAYIDHMGVPGTTVVPLRQAGQERPNAREWAEWMPYQVGQAAKVYDSQDFPAPSREDLKPGPIVLVQKESPPFKDTCSFGWAVELLKAGNKVARAGWNGKGMWLCLVDWSQYQVTEVAHLVHDTPRPLPWIGMRTADNGFVPWLASQTDILAEDWTVVL
ncbi:DUF2829 domain-containing protein [Variovorax sp. dw_954]|uniref:DUF2829 domain-containing protein n=1 Tax=Variovorax sp. dw_954 TaxID=2720078 RepID=UPI001BD3C02A|nr:DUF2829 domain-containing protein [Variovorax sp. dw_954]